jgi:hypothetical protein
MCASFLRISEALHLDIYHQPHTSQSFDSLVSIFPTGYWKGIGEIRSRFPKQTKRIVIRDVCDSRRISRGSLNEIHYPEYIDGFRGKMIPKNFKITLTAKIKSSPEYEP